MSQQHCRFDASRSLTALEQDSTIIAVIEMSQSKWLVAALVPAKGDRPCCCPGTGSSLRPGSPPESAARATTARLRLSL